MKRTTLLFTLLFTASAFPCSQFIPGVFPSKLRAVSGFVQGSPNPNRTKLGNRPALAGVRVELRVRTDKSFVEETSDPSAYREKMLRQYKGAITDYDCGALVASAQTDGTGKFNFTAPPKGKYCLKVVLNPKTKRLGLNRGLEPPIDVDAADGGSGIVLDVSPLMTDCSSGGTLVLH